MEQIRVTEQASAYDDLQRMSVHDLLTGINREDRRVADAVAATIPTMERLVERIVERMQRGGRMFYIGAGTSGRLAVTDASELPPTYGVPFDTVIGLITWIFLKISKTSGILSQGLPVFCRKTAP